MIPTDLVDLSRFQFALTAMYHFLFVPLTLGMSFLVCVMELTYVMTGKEIYKDMTRFWGKLFGINFALGVATGITMEFQFGTNWAYYSHYVGDIFGAPLAIEGLMAFFLESTFIGLFFFGWSRLSKGKHLLATFLMAIGSNLSALWILVANAWMQYPAGAEFTPVTMRMELTNFWAVVSSEWAQAKFVHTVSSAYMCAAIFVMAISAYYMLKRQDVKFAKSSFRMAAVFGVVASILTLQLGDESGYLVTRDQPTKIAAMEAMWETEPAPAPLTLFALPDQATQTNKFEIQLPWVMGIIGTRSLSTPIPGVKELEARAEQRITMGKSAVVLLEQLRKDPKNAELLKQFNAVKDDLGYGLLLKRYTNDVANATPEMIKEAAASTIPNVLPMFVTFRVMVGLGMLMLLLFIVSLVYSVKDTIDQKKGFLKIMLFSLPLPWIAIECGWFIAEYGRQPWTIYDVLPTHLSVSALSSWDLIGSIAGFALLYSALIVVEVWLMTRVSRRGPSSLGTGRYHFEKN